jgi:hypothetical protein
LGKAVPDLKLPQNLFAFCVVIAVAVNHSIIANAVYDNMQVWVLRIVMAEDNILVLDEPVHFEILFTNLLHLIISQVFMGWKVDRGMVEIPLKIRALGFNDGNFP